MISLIDYVIIAINNLLSSAGGMMFVAGLSLFAGILITLIIDAIIDVLRRLVR